jgi:hypothetical protein
VKSRIRGISSESGRGTRLASKPFQGLRIAREFIGQKFQGDKAAKLGVLSFIDNTHSAATELLDDAVVRNGLADLLSWTPCME